MAAPVKKRACEIDKNSSSKLQNSGSESSDDEFGSGEQEYKGQEEIQVEFEGRNLTDTDFHGIKQLLNQLFLKAHVNLSDLTDLLISQNYVGSVIKQSSDVGDDEEDEDDDESDVNDVFGVTSVINLTEKKDVECVKELRKLLLELCTEHGSDNTLSLVRTLLTDNNKHVGLLINERFVNIPPQIVAPLLKSLSSEMRRANDKKMPFEFSYFILICKLYKLDLSNVKKKNKSKKNKEKIDNELIWSNAEEELIDQFAEAKFEFSVKSESDSGLSGHWSESDSELTPYRRVLLIPASNFDQLIYKIEEFVQK